VSDRYFIFIFYGETIISSCHITFSYYSLKNGLMDFVEVKFKWWGENST
jgi:hypothetical protein